MIGAVSAYSPAYASSAYFSAVRNVQNSQINPGVVSPVKAVPEVFSNAETERTKKTAAETEDERNTAYDRMKAGTSRTAENLNGRIRFGGSEQGKQVGEAELRRAKRAGIEECETCKNRKYVDGSDEGNVSFKAPGHIAPEAAASRVMAHEQEHVANAKREGNSEDAELVSATVTLETSICPECGKSYVSGGETQTVIKHFKQ